MSYRGNESPMDFQWQGMGPVDTTSPFHKHAMENAKKRTHTQTTSPSKFPSLRDPKNQPYFFTAPPAVAPSSPYRAPSFTTPRKPFDVPDFSSGPESSPRNRDYNETDQDTPDGKPLPSIPIDFKAGSARPKPEKRNSIVRWFTKSFSPSHSATSPSMSGRGEVLRPVHNDAVSKRLHKHRRQAQKYERQVALRKRGSHDDGESDYTPSEDSDGTPRKKISRNARVRSKPLPNTTSILDKALPNPTPIQVSQPGLLPSIFTFIHTHPHLPSILTQYTQTLFNFLLASIALYTLYTLLSGIATDIRLESSASSAAALLELSACTKAYIDNRCSPETRLPALEGPCGEWEICMRRNPDDVKRGRISASAFAEILNSFVRPIELKTVLVFGGLFLLLVVGNNAGFGWLRRSQVLEERNVKEVAREHLQQSNNGNGGQVPIYFGTPFAQQQLFGGNEWPMQAVEGRESPSKSGRRDRDRDRDGSRSPEKKRIMLGRDRDT